MNLNDCIGSCIETRQLLSLHLSNNSCINNETLSNQCLDVETLRNCLALSTKTLDWKSLEPL